MQIKTKRGPRRIRNQRVRDRRFVVTDYTDCPYVTPGKMYRSFKGCWDSALLVMDDDNDEITVALNRTSLHLDGTGTWYHPIR